MFTPRLTIFYLAAILRPSHACGVRAGFSNILLAGRRKEQSTVLKEISGVVLVRSFEMLVYEFMSSLAFLSSLSHCLVSKYTNLKLL
jgi:hypothetical protein